MEVEGMEEVQKSESQMTSAAAFVEGGVQEACDDACSICLEEFCDSDPSTLTKCKHEFHLQCILEWCQRSSQCPMCLQPIILKDPSSQELLEAVERERNIRLTPPRSAIFHHPTLGDFELQHLPVGANDPELEERIIQHLAAAAAMGRAHHIARREGQRSRSSAHGRPHFLVFSTHPNATASGPVPASLAQVGESEPAAITIPSPSIPAGGDEPSQEIPQFPSVQTDHLSPSASRAAITPRRLSFNNRSASQSSPDQNRAGPSDLQSFSESLKARLNAVSTRYKESISKSTRGWKERLFSRNNSMADLGSEVRGEANSGMAGVSRIMERLEIRENTRVVSQASVSSASVSSDQTDSVTEQNNQDGGETHAENPLNDSNIPATCAASSGLN